MPVSSKGPFSALPLHAFCGGAPKGGWSPPPWTWVGAQRGQTVTVKGGPASLFPSLSSLLGVPAAPQGPMSPLWGLCCPGGLFSWRKGGVGVWGSYLTPHFPPCSPGCATLTPDALLRTQSHRTPTQRSSLWSPLPVPPPKPTQHQNQPVSAAGRAASAWPPCPCAAMLGHPDPSAGGTAPLAHPSAGATARCHMGQTWGDLAPDASPAQHRPGAIPARLDLASPGVTTG